MSGTTSRPGGIPSIPGISLAIANQACGVLRSLLGRQRGTRSKAFVPAHANQLAKLRRVASPHERTVRP